MTGTSDSKRKRPEAPGEPVMVRLQPGMLDWLDNWRRSQKDLPSRPEAIRQLLERALKSHDAANARKRR